MNSNKDKFKQVSQLCVTAIVVAALLTPNAYCAEKKKKKETVPATTQTQTDKLTSSEPTPQVTETTKAKWEQEPTSFIGIKLDQPLQNSIMNACPTTINDHTVDYGIALRQGGLCYLDYYLTRGSDYYVIYGFSIKPLKLEAYVTTLDKSLDGKVGKIETIFKSEDFTQVAEMLTIKYGSPHRQEAGKLKTNGGAEFSHVELYWTGDNVLIYADSMASRSYNQYAHQIDETGVIRVTTKSYLNKKSSESSEAASKGAAGL